MTKLLVAGTPGTGKTTFCKEFLKEHKEYFYLNTSEEIKRNKLYESFSEKHESYEYDIEKVSAYFKNMIDLHENVVIDTHDPEIFEDLVDLDCIVVMSCDLDVLDERYVKRGYKEDKIGENLDCERFDDIKHIVKDIWKESVENILFVSSCIETSTKKRMCVKDALVRINKFIC